MCFLSSETKALSLRQRARKVQNGIDLKKPTVNDKLQIMTNKEIVQDLLERIPDDASLHDIARELEFIAAVRQGLTELDNGQSVTVEELERDLTSWRIKYDSHIPPEQT